ncbi:MAG: 50S ribosomal protein L4 [Candidatus Micrarchaeia archaeon]
MQVDICKIDGTAIGKAELPQAFSKGFHEHLVRRALLAEQSLKYQPQGHYVLAGMQTTAAYIGRMNSYRTGRHMGIAIRPRQKLGGGAMGDVRRIPSSVKGRRAHPHTVNKKIAELINAKEYREALKSAISGAVSSEVRERIGREMPIIVEDKIESIVKTKELVNVLYALGLGNDLEKSHKPKLRKGLTASKSRIRKFRKSVLIVAKDASKLEIAGANIPGVDVCSVSELSVVKLAPGAAPRPMIWSEAAIKELDSAIGKRRL